MVEALEEVCLGKQALDYQLAMLCIVGKLDLFDSPLLAQRSVHGKPDRGHAALADGHQEAVPTSDRLLLAGNHLFHHTFSYCPSIMTALLSTGLFL